MIISSFRLELNAVKRNGEILYNNKLFRMEDFSTTLEMTVLFIRVLNHLL